MTVHAVPRGWDSPEWAGFFPEGLPEEWRLGFFANEFRALLLPAGLLARVAEAADDVPGGFRYFLDLRDGTVPDPAALMPLGGRLAGILLPPDLMADAAVCMAPGVPLAVVAAHHDPALEAAAAGLGADFCWPGGHSGPGRLAWCRAAAADPRALRAAVEQAADWAPAGTGLVELDTGGPAALRNARVVIDLLGL